jgi:hypothetical protein
LEDKVQKTLRFLAPTCKLRQLAASRTLYIRPPRLRGVGGADARARPWFVPRTDRVSSIDRMSIFRRCSGGFGARGKATASPRPPRRFDVVALRRLSGGNIRYRRGGCWGVPGCACEAGAVPHRRNRRRRLFPSIRTPSNTVPDARDDSRGRLPPRGTDRRKLESSFQTKDAKQWPKKN